MARNGFERVFPRPMDSRVRGNDGTWEFIRPVDSRVRGNDGIHLIWRI